MTKTGSPYPADVIQRAVMFTAMISTPGDPATYRYTLAVERLKAEFGIDVPESTLRSWCASHPEYAGAVKVLLDLGVEDKINETIASAFAIVAEGLKLLKADPKRLASLSANDLKQIVTVAAIAFDKKKILDAGRAAENEIEGQKLLEFDTVRRDRDGNIIPQHPNQIELSIEDRREAAEG